MRMDITTSKEEGMEGRGHSGIEEKGELEAGDKNGNKQMGRRQLRGTYIQRRNGDTKQRSEMGKWEGVAMEETGCRGNEEKRR